MNVLVIDDHPLYRTGVVFQLQAAEPDIAVHECASVDAGLRMMEDGLRVDLMMLDLHMPGFTRLQALEEVRRRQPDIPVLVLSGDEDPEIVRKSVELGACGFLPKSSPAATLHPALKLVISGGVFLPASSLSVAREPAQRPAHPGTQGLAGQLTQRQCQVLLGLVQGKANKTIARDLDLSDSTVKTHVNNLFNIFGVNNRTQVVYALARSGVSIRELAGADAH